MGKHKPSIIEFRAELETEYMEPLADIVAGFIPMGSTRRDAAGALGVSTNSLNEYCRAEGIHFPSLQTRRAKSSRFAHFQEESEQGRRQSISRTRRARGKKYTHAGRSMGLTDWAEFAGINKSTLHMRLSRGESMDRALRPGRN